MGPALVGFCTPRSSEIIAALLKHLQPTHPIDLLDQIQIEAMSRILKVAKLRSKARQLTDFSIDIPFFHLRLVNAYSIEQERLEAEQRDQYDFMISQLRLTCRMQAHHDAEDQECETHHGLLVHAQADEVSVAVSERSADLSNDLASARGVIRNVVFWLGSQQEANAKLQMRSIEVAVWSSQVEYLASLIHRTGAVVENIARGFDISDHSKCLRHLVYHLTREGAGVTDPVFLTKPSYVLRSAGDHLRQNDSWKIISRLRFIYRSLPRALQMKIVAEAEGRHVEYPEDAESHVLTSFEQWRNWDHGQVQNSFIMNRIWAGTAVASPASPGSQPLYAELSVGNTKLLIDPGPKQNEFILGDMGVALTMVTVPDGTVVSPAKDVTSFQRVTVQSYCSQMALHLNWNLVDLVGDTLAQFKSQPTQVIQSVAVTRRLSKTVSQSQEIHIVFGTDNALIRFDSINLTVAMAAERLRASAIHGTKFPGDKTSDLVLSATSASAKLKNTEGTILGWKLFLPLIDASYVLKPDKNPVPKVLRLVGVCHRLRFDLKQDIMKVLDTAHRVIGDEFKHFQELVSSANGQKSSVPRDRDEDRPVSSTADVHVAMFLDDYKMSFALTPSLTYTISGEVARTSVRPMHDSKNKIDIDIKRHSHSLHSSGWHKQQDISTLHIPPINVTVMAKRSNSIISVDVDTIIERVDLEAAEVRSCIDMLNTPELARLAMDAKNSARDASSKFDRISGASGAVASSGKPGSGFNMLGYTARVTLTGLAVHCSAPGLKSQDYHADLSVGVGLTTICLHNRTAQETLIHERPQFDLHVRRAFVELGRRTRAGVKTYGRLNFSAKAEGTTEKDERGNTVQTYRTSSSGLAVDLFAETAFLVVDVAAFLQERIRSLVITDEVKQIRPLRRLTTAGLTKIPDFNVHGEMVAETGDAPASSTLFDSVYSLDLSFIQVKWIVENRSPVQSPASPARELEDLVFSIQKIDLATKREGSARLAITDLQLQMVPLVQASVRQILHCFPRWCLMWPIYLRSTIVVLLFRQPGRLSI